ncbi:hypothetical protein BD324DRAFT_650826 [Kockovaella imperatae]|uniref:Uncharacterized protein n=1 Tax=Kockovaella imperatae TaxID=4999 RepID=A0A1Y1UGN1_9TREE|nr:hypothetical protein BD324DRAFT_650826 [Kockovaella imperatae]ORX37220.1 hypothetical protein BD324DRAFT_650826 [Kockovaella imperatae]
MEDLVNLALSDSPPTPPTSSFSKRDWRPSMGGLWEPLRPDSPNGASSKDSLHGFKPKPPRPVGAPLSRSPPSTWSSQTTVKSTLRATAEPFEVRKGCINQQHSASVSSLTSFTSKSAPRPTVVSPGTLTSSEKMDGLHFEWIVDIGGENIVTASVVPKLESTSTNGLQAVCRLNSPPQGNATSRQANRKVSQVPAPPRVEDMAQRFSALWTAFEGFALAFHDDLKRLKQNSVSLPDITHEKEMNSSDRVAELEREVLEHKALAVKASEDHKICLSQLEELSRRNLEMGDKLDAYEARMAKPPNSSTSRDRRSVFVMRGEMDMFDPALVAQGALGGRKTSAVIRDRIQFAFNLNIDTQQINTITIVQLFVTLQALLNHRFLNFIRGFQEDHDLNMLSFSDHEGLAIKAEALVQFYLDQPDIDWVVVGSRSTQGFEHRSDKLNAIRSKIDQDPFDHLGAANLISVPVLFLFQDNEEEEEEDQDHMSTSSRTATTRANTPVPLSIFPQATGGSSARSQPPWPPSPPLEIASHHPPWQRSDGCPTENASAIDSTVMRTACWTNITPTRPDP